MKRKNIIITISVIVLALSFQIFSAQKAFAAMTYTTTDVAKHSIATDCWMIFESGVYDLTAYLKSHDKFMNIRSWCGKDMTEDFMTKDGKGVDHKSSTYNLLEAYKIGELQTATNSTTGNPYNFFLPVLLTLGLYFGTEYLTKKKKSNGTPVLQKHTFNLVWNVILLLSLIPSALFGIYMIARYSFSDLAKVDFDFTYWHVEGALVMASIALGHIISRLPQLIGQLKLSVKRRK